MDPTDPTATVLVKRQSGSFLRWPTLFTAGSHSTDFMRHLVSKKKCRFVLDGFDLDLTYITPRLIAMGFPSTGAESLYRNPAAQVKQFLARYHAGHAKVYNLCVEPDRQYQAGVLGLPDELLEVHATYDHNPCPLVCMLPFCRSVRAWIDANEKNVAVVHCKAGKGRTGMMLCAYLVWSGAAASADDAMHTYGDKRTKNGKGVTIPSQKRYVGYTKALGDSGGTEDSPGTGSSAYDEGGVDGASVAAPEGAATLPNWLRMPPLLYLVGVRLLHAPDWVLTPATYFTVDLVALEGQSLAGIDGARSPRWRSWCVYDHRPHSDAGASQDTARPGILRRLSVGGGPSGKAIAAPPTPPTQPYQDMQCPENARPPLSGDVKVTIYGPKGKLAACWFHTAFIRDGQLQLSKREIDKACKDKKGALGDEFGLVLHFAEPGTAQQEEESRATIDSKADYSRARSKGSMSSISSAETEGQSEAED